MSHADWLCRMVVNGLFLLFVLACWHAVEAWPVCLFSQKVEFLCLMPIGYVEWLLIDCFCSVLACWHAVEV